MTPTVISISDVRDEKRTNPLVYEWQIKKTPTPAIKGIDVFVFRVAVK